MLLFSMGSQASSVCWHREWLPTGTGAIVTGACRFPRSQTPARPQGHGRLENRATAYGARCHAHRRPGKASPGPPRPRTTGGSGGFCKLATCSWVMQIQSPTKPLPTNNNNNKSQIVPVLGGCPVISSRHVATRPGFRCPASIRPATAPGPARRVCHIKQGGSRAARWM